MTTLEKFQAAQAAVAAGNYEEAMALLAECDQEDSEGYRMLTTRVRHEIAALRQEEVSSSAGTSFSTSESTPGSSGFSLPATESSLQLPVPETASLSSKDQAQSLAPSSTVPLTDGSTQETGSSLQSQSDSSDKTQEADAPVTASTGDPEQRAMQLMLQAKTAYDAGKYDEADSFLDEAVAAYPGVGEAAEKAHAAVKLARATAF